MNTNIRISSAFNLKDLYVNNITGVGIPPFLFEVQKREEDVMGLCYFLIPRNTLVVSHSYVQKHLAIKSSIFIFS